MKKLTGEMFDVSFGKLIIHAEQSESFAIGDMVEFERKIYQITAIIPPTKPNGKWALKVK